VNAAMDAGVKDLYLFHLDPNYSDDQVDAMLEHSRKIIKQAKSTMRCHVAREGMRIDLGGRGQI
jgi:ribonuclease BN (tRNA processing enzyme)